MKAKELSLVELIQLTDRVDVWKRLPDEHDSHGGYDMVDNWSLDYEWTKKSYQGSVEGICVKVSQTCRVNYPWLAGKPIKRQVYGISASQGDVSLGERVNSKVKNTYLSIEASYEQKIRKEQEEKKKSAIKKARSLLK